MLYPSLTRIRSVSVTVAREVIREAQRQGLDREPSIRKLSDEQLDQWIMSRMYDPRKENGFPELGARVEEKWEEKEERIAAKL